MCDTLFKVNNRLRSYEDLSQLLTDLDNKKVKISHEQSEKKLSNKQWIKQLNKFNSYIEVYVEDLRYLKLKLRNSDYEYIIGTVDCALLEIKRIKSIYADLISE